MTEHQIHQRGRMAIVSFALLGGALLETHPRSLSIGPPSPPQGGAISYYGTRIRPYDSANNRTRLD